MARNFTSYFNSYAQVAPQWQSFLDLHEGHPDVEPIPGFHPDYLASMCNPDGTPMFTLVTAENYPKLFAALEDECSFRGVPMPACYIDHSSTVGLGRAYRDFYAISIEEAAEEVLSRQELRYIVAHEVKHLYQCDWETISDCLDHEYDCDRAGVESAGYEAVRSFFHKAAELRIKQKIKFPPLRSILLHFHAAFPNFLSERVPFAPDLEKTNLTRLRIVKDPYHPSPATRMKAMREWEQEIQGRHSDEPELVSE